MPTITPTPTTPAVVVYDFVDEANYADWENGRPRYESVAFGSINGDSGSALEADEGTRLEDSTVADNYSTLLVIPNSDGGGCMTGLYPAYTVQEGDRFEAQVGFIELSPPHSSIQSAFQVVFLPDNGSPQGLYNLTKSYNGKLNEIDADLAFLAGRRGQFALTMCNAGPFDRDYGVWHKAVIRRQ